jgi:hypothetical protein
MADNQAIKLLDRQIVTNNQITAPVDVGAYAMLQVQVRVHEAGGAGTIFLTQSAVDEPLSFSQLGDTVDLTAASESGDFQSHSNFLRYVRCRAANVSGTQPIVSVDIIAKEF